MVMVDRLVSAEGLSTTTAFRIREETLFVEDGFFREPGLIENMARTAAVRTGAKPGVAGGTPPIGVIGGIRNLEIFGFPAVGEEITTTVIVLHDVFNATIADARVMLGDRLLARCELKIFLAEA